MKKIKGTVAYFKNMLYDLLASFRCLGPPTLFMTLSADDLHWPELGMTLEDIEFREAFGKSFSSSMRSDPLLTATHFERRFRSLLKNVILNGCQPLGKVTDYFARVEFQNRGSPHIHMFLWIADVPKQINNATAVSALEYIDRTIFSKLPDQNADPELYSLVHRLQRHHHTAYCSVRKAKCRFGFPRQVSGRSRLLSNMHIQSQNRGRFYITARDVESKFINDYNDVILRHWRANMDLQYIQNAEGAAYYVCSYLCKSEPDDLKNALGNLIHTVLSENPSLPRNVRLMKIGLCVLKHRRMSAQEAAYRMGSLQLLHASREFVYLNTWPLQKRMKILRSTSDLQALSGEDTNVFKHNILDYYRARPFTLEACSLLYFASWYVKVTEPKKKENKIYCAQYNVWFRKKGKFSVVRYPKFAFGSEEYFYSMLMLLFPHRTEDDLFSDMPTAREAFDAKQEFFDSSVSFMYETIATEIENAVRRIRLTEEELSNTRGDLPEENSGDNLAPDISSLPLFEESNIPYNESMNSFSADNDVITEFHSLECCIMSIDDFNCKLHSLSSCQKHVLHEIMSHFSNTSIDTGPFHYFISGGAGSGKSFILNMIVAYLQLFTSIQPGVSPVVVCAPTGTAARNVRGSTIHSLLKIPVNNFLEYEPLSQFLLSKLQRQFQPFATIIIDEISMVSAAMLTYISRRLSEIKNNECPFGGLNVIVVGDFFQLRPVRGKYAFTNSLLWRLFHLLFLKQNMRQSQDPKYACLLDHARLGILTKNDIAMLVERLNFEPSQVDNVIHLFALRSDVAAFNSAKLAKSSSPTVHIPSVHYFGHYDVDAGSEVPSNFFDTCGDDVGGLSSHLTLCLGARVMLIRNIHIEQGLVNGAMGYIHSFEISDSGVVQTVNILFDDPCVGRVLRISGCSYISIERVEYSSIINGRSVITCQFPLTLSWACTIHKVQGLSLSKVVIDLGSTVFEKGMAYVALSRVTSLSGLYLLKFSPAVVQPPCSVLEEYERMRSTQ